MLIDELIFQVLLMSAKLDFPCKINMGYLKMRWSHQSTYFVEGYPWCKFQLPTIYGNRDFRGVGIPFFVEAIPSSGSLYFVWDMTPIEIIEQSISWLSTPERRAQELKTVSLRFSFMNVKNLHTASTNSNLPY